MNVWAAVVTVVGSVLTLLGVGFTGRATVRAAAATARANQAAAAIQTEPNQRAEDRAAFEAVKAELRAELAECRVEVRSLRSLVRAFAWYVGELTSQMRRNGIEPPAPPQRVDEYNRTGV